MSKYKKHQEQEGNRDNRKRNRTWSKCGLIILPVSLNHLHTVKWDLERAAFLLRKYMHMCTKHAHTDLKLPESHQNSEHLKMIKMFPKG